MFLNFINTIKKLKINNFGKKNKIINFFSGFKKENKKINNYKEKFKKKYKGKIRKKNKIQLQLNLSKINYKKCLLNLIIYSSLILLLILKTSFFKIQNINVISLDSNTNPKLIEKNLNYLKNKLIFKIQNKTIEKKIFDIEQNINKIKIHKRYPNTLNINIGSYNVLFKTIIKNKTYLITSNGVFIPKKNLKDNLKTIKIRNINIPAYPLYKKILNIDELKKIHIIKEKLTENIVGLQIKDIIYYKTEKEAHFIINNNTIIIFDLVGNLKEKLNQIYVFNKEKKNILKPGIVYIDNRILGKIYYCPTKEKNQCEKNLNYIYNLKNN